VTPSPPRTTSDERRDSILRAAAQLIRERGLAQVGIDDIGAEVGLSGPALYRYFEGKQTLLAEIITDHLDRIRREFDSLQPRHSRSQARSADHTYEDTSTAATVSALVSTALREPNAMYVMVRYAGTLRGEQLARVREAQARLGGMWDALLPPLVDEAEWTDSTMRARAIAGLLTHLALTRSGSRAQRGGLARACITDLCTIDLGPFDQSRRQAPNGAPLLPHLDRREAILAVAIPLFGDRGYTAVSLKDIGEPLGITGSAVARQFGSKEDLLAAAIMRGSEQISAGVALALRRSTTASEAVRAMLESYVSLAVDFPELVVVQNIEPYALSTQYRSERRKRHRVYIAELARVIGLADPTLHGVVSKLRAGAVFGALNEAIVGSARAKEAIDATDLLRLASTIALPLETRSRHPSATAAASASSTT
jgi:AcrR family transcriptional regulator